MPYINPFGSTEDSFITKSQFIYDYDNSEHNKPYNYPRSNKPINSTLIILLLAYLTLGN